MSVGKRSIKTWYPMAWYHCVKIAKLVLQVLAGRLLLWGGANTGNVSFIIRFTLPIWPYQPDLCWVLCLHGYCKRYIKTQGKGQVVICEVQLVPFDDWLTLGLCVKAQVLKAHPSAVVVTSYNDFYFFSFIILLTK